MQGGAWPGSDQPPGGTSRPATKQLCTLLLASPPPIWGMPPVQRRGTVMAFAVPCRTANHRVVVAGYVYLIRNRDLHKIGITTDLVRRMRELKPDEVIATAELDDHAALERELHRRYKDQRLPQSEYFRLSDAQVQEAARTLSSSSGSPNPESRGANTILNALRDALHIAAQLAVMAVALPAAWVAGLLVTVELSPYWAAPFTGTASLPASTWLWWRVVRLERWWR